MAHVGIFGIIVNLILATWCVVYIAQTRKTSRHPVLTPLLLYSICYIVLVFLFLIWFYQTLNLSDQPVSRSVLDAGMMAIAVLEILMVASMFAIYRSFHEKKLSRNLQRIFWAGVVLFILSYGIKILLSPGWVKNVLKTIHYQVFDNVILLEIVILVVILVRARKISDPAASKMSRTFALLYLSRYFLPIALTLVITFVTPLPRPIKLIIALVPFFYCNLVPILWIRRGFQKAEGSVGEESWESSRFKETVRTHAVSQREEEILKLLLQGKSHKDIEEELFISYHTVKNHIYNIYQKLGVKNRHQLFHIFSNRAKL